MRYSLFVTHIFAFSKEFSLKSDSELTFKMIIVFIPLLEVRYYVECQEKDLIWYHPRGIEEDRRQHLSDIELKSRLLAFE